MKRTALFIALLIFCSFLYGCPDNKPSTPAPTPAKPPQATRQFPAGEFNIQDMILEVKDGPTFRASEMALFKGMVKVSSTGTDRIDIETATQMKRRATDPIKNDKRIDRYSIQWTDDRHGKLMNSSPDQPSGDFTIEPGRIIIKAWVARNNAWETHIYETGKVPSATPSANVFIKPGLYSIDTTGWDRKQTPTGDVYICSTCSAQIQIQIDFGQPLPADSKVQTNSEFIAGLRTPEQQKNFAQEILKASIPMQSGYSFDIERVGIEQIGGLDVIQYAAVVTIGDKVMRDGTMIGIHKKRMFKIGLNYYDGALNPAVQAAIRSLYGSLKFI